MAFNQNIAQEYNRNKILTENIITEFKVTLNHKYAVAEDFEKIYDYIYSLLVEANISKDIEVLNRALDEIRGMRDTWKEVMKRAKSTNQ